MLFDRKGFSRDDLEREIRSEMAYLTELYGDRAHEVALERAARKRLSPDRRKIIQAAAKRLAPDPKDIKSRS